MKILYAIQATGNGHISRAKQIIPILKEYSSLDLFLSGDNYSLSLGHEVRYQSKGVSLRWKQCGKLDYLESMKCIKAGRVYKEIKDLPVEQYDLVLNDFEFISARACRRKNIPIIHFGHQASFRSKKTPRPKNKSWIGETILTRYAPIEKTIGLHFKSYDNGIYPPIIRQDISEAESKNHGHITIYLPGYHLDCFKPLTRTFNHIDFHIFSPYVQSAYKADNVSFFCASTKEFAESLVHSDGIICGAGFETPAEALFLRKKIIAIPIKGHYEQECNAAALSLLGVKIASRLEDISPMELNSWLNQNHSIEKIHSLNIRQILVHCIEQGFQNN
ncbi:MAG TPA: glycosyltransferase family protein [Saprospiraceae bacterium]|nr:glycosyltransferase family protein [Saprospiraceae bacterium]